MIKMARIHISDETFERIKDFKRQNSIKFPTGKFIVDTAVNKFIEENGGIK